MTLSTVGSDFDTLLGVYTGKSLGRLHSVTTNDNTAQDVVTSAVTFQAVAGVTYHFAVDGEAGATGDIVLTLQAAAAA